ncbi:methyltransferase-like protein 27 isoform X2 [Babylonia areolata]|uniref:methyltransferase-like protein 27 isoform X2 n=1 Tax=Babylonia areolata TaxID=304850 RepID=UPI003FD6BEBF
MEGFSSSGERVMGDEEEELTMAEQKARRFMESQASETAEAYCCNFRAHRPGISLEESTRVYDQWTTYEEDLNHERYRGPEIAAQAVGEFFQTDREKPLVIDVACGTGFVGEQLKKLGFKQLHALDPSQTLLGIARHKNIYEQDFLCYLNEKRLPIDDDVYDCAVIAGGMGEGHIPTSGLYELSRIVKPGGMVCIVMREEYLEHVEEYRGRLENTMRRMEEEGAWTLASRVTVPRYSFDNTGVVFKFIVC